MKKKILKIFIISIFIINIIGVSFASAKPVSYSTKLDKLIQEKLIQYNKKRYLIYYDGNVAGQYKDNITTSYKVNILLYDDKITSIDNNDGNDYKTLYTNSLILIKYDLFTGEIEYPRILPNKVTDSLEYYKNELNYNSDTFEEWGKTAGVVIDSTGIEVTASTNNEYINLPTNLFPNTKYLFLYEVVSSNLNSIIGHSSLSAFPSANINKTIGNNKMLLTTRESITSNQLHIGVYSSNTAGTKIKLRNLRLIVVPTGSQIEIDANVLTADQLALKYPYVDYTAMDNNLVKVNRVNEYILKQEDITSFINTDEILDIIVIDKPLDFIGYNNTNEILFNSFSLQGFNNKYILSNYNLSNIGYVSNNTYPTKLAVFVDKNTYATLDDAKNDLVGSIIQYQLDIPTTQNASYLYYYNDNFMFSNDVNFDLYDIEKVSINLGKYVKSETTINKNVSGTFANIVKDIFVNSGQGVNEIFKSFILTSEGNLTNVAILGLVAMGLSFGVGVFYIIFKKVN